MRESSNASLPGMSSGTITACFFPERLAARLPRPGSWRPYLAARDRAAWDAVEPATASTCSARRRAC